MGALSALPDANVDDRPDDAAGQFVSAALLTRPGHELWKQLSSQITNVVALFDDGTLYVLKGHRADMHVRDFVQRAKGLGYEVRVVLEVNMDELNRLRSGSKDLAGNRAPANAGEYSTDIDPAAVGISYIRAAFAAGATDIHFEVSHAANRTTIDIRVNTLIHPRFGEQAAEIGEKIIRALYNLGDSGDGSFNTKSSKSTRLTRQSVEERSTRKLELPDGIKLCRFTSFPIQDGIACSMRIHPVAAAGRSMLQLGLAQPQVDLLMELGTDGEGGLTLIAGMTGSGKTTLLKSWLEAVYAHYEGTKRFVGVQDPHEVDIVGMLSLDASATDDATARESEYDAILKRIARADPDFLLMGEIRDKSSAQLAMSLANFGTFVTSTFHAESAAALPFRLNGAEFALEDTKVFNHHVTRGLAHMRLLPMVCPECSIPRAEWSSRRAELHAVGSFRMTEDQHFDLYDKIVARIETYGARVSGAAPDMSMVRARGLGCRNCCGDRIDTRPRPLRGIKGMTIAAHVMRTDARFMSLVRRGLISKAESYAYARDGEVNRMTSLDRAVAQMLAGSIDPSAVHARFKKLQSDRMIDEDPATSGDDLEATP
ncbi:MAG: Flp pilus assembly complex ATPase component TadA [Rhizorhabdus sp.]|uniref:ATPase, T2SS/T4P/T4SS family n=1 Tax=Rhizorhabdus sp. TaxID=1968843 RepID=UPI001B452252|nr:ATPase, T2SS/T4P/T4SS family [Rhizorhabdus sp.]MBP8231535.1 Flp pilus assembly complex ATPase component TadA [Rhizorhabdus sp.]